jgi:hypothetical protein
MDSASSMEVTMSEENNYLVQQPFKRRRFHTAIEHAESGQLNPFNHSPAFAAFGSQSARTPFATVNGKLDVLSIEAMKTKQRNTKALMTSYSSGNTNAFSCLTRFESLSRKV